MAGVSANPPAGTQSTSDASAVAEAERSGRPFLLFRDGDDRPQLFQFAPGSGSVSVGRGASSGLALGWDSQVSRQHARFEQTEGGWEIIDDGPSRNGTFVNGERVTGRRQLNDFDQLRFGATTVTFRSPAPAASHSVAVSLSTTQRRVLAALCAGSAGPAGDERIAEELVLSVGEVRAHLRVLCAKLGIDGPPDGPNRARLVERATSGRLI
jgi:DNA-binding CsgD family transcriptional regulator